ncbi:MAG: sulfite exporter TauE/SafE family protein [Paracoccus sp. (in: a-proteobacteria)]|uniref:sulfite exporter TauE/SafE family protein n=1 Tax=Paracoccus sp. TaxID=267 RepID=UPI0026E01552|nr:sulfite exporter TauE/SafE family protein [Paracoccus sp. (in: a-proteobacteria)]MDO5620106.1 sulfite exporter TauE/SafE family protein [Paracoccus sp. (in: a-proteobacteria)]
MTLTEALPLILTLAAFSALAGVLAGLLGIGGGIVLVPVFAWVFDKAGYGGPDLMQICLATSLATIVVTSARSVMAHHGKGAVDWDILRQWAPGIAIGAIIGVATVSSLRTPTLQAIFGVLVMLIAIYMIVSRPSWKLANDMPQGPVKWALSAASGFLSVLLGIGGGSLGVPLMTLHGRPIHRAVATAAGFGVLIAVPSVIAFLFLPARNAPPLTVGSVNLAAFFIVIALTMLTAPLGAALAHRTDPVRLKRIFAGFLVIVALNMLRKALM